MEKRWFILIEGVEEGPYSTTALLRDPRINPDTLVREASDPSWKPIRFIPELIELFDQDGRAEENSSESPDNIGFCQLALTLQSEPPYLRFWLLLVLLILIYVFYRLYFIRP